MFEEAENQLSPNASRTEQVYNEFTDVYDNGQQDYPSVSEEMNEDVAIEPLQVTPEGPPSPEIPLTIPGDKASLTEDWRRPEDLILRYKTLFMKEQRLSKLVSIYTSQVKSITVVHIVRQLHKIESTPFGARNARNTMSVMSTYRRITYSSTQVIDIEDSISQLQVIAIKYLNSQAHRDCFHECAYQARSA